MNIKQKLEIVEKAVRSISEHDDADSVVVLTALGNVTKIAIREAEAVRAKQATAAKALEA